MVRNINRIFNMNKKLTALGQTNKIEFSKLSGQMLHSIVVCVGATGFALPPLFVVPGQHLSQQVMMDGYDIPDGTGTVTAKGIQINTQSKDIYLYNSRTINFVKLLLEMAKQTTCRDSNLLLQRP
jgi:hypothetical protein